MRLTVLAYLHEISIKTLSFFQNNIDIKKGKVQKKIDEYRGVAYYYSVESWTDLKSFHNKEALKRF